MVCVIGRLWIRWFGFGPLDVVWCRGTSHCLEKCMY